MSKIIKFPKRKVPNVEPSTVTFETRVLEIMISYAKTNGRAQGLIAGVLISSIVNIIVSMCCK